MIDVASERIASYFVKEKIIKNEDKEVYSYGLQLLLSTLINLVTVFIISIIAHRVVETFLLVFIFILLRLSAGGYHAKNHLNCFFIFISEYIVFLVILALLNSKYYVNLCISNVIISDILIILLAPVEDVNKLLSKEEKRIGRIRSIILILIISIAIFVLINFIENVYLVSVSLSMLFVAVSLVAGKIKNLVTNNS